MLHLFYAFTRFVINLLNRLDHTSNCILEKSRAYNPADVFLDCFRSFPFNLSEKRKIPKSLVTGRWSLNLFLTIE